MKRTLARSVSPHPPEVRAALCDAFNQLTLDTLALGAAAWLAHRNVRGPLFRELHKLFGKLGEVLYAHADALPEYVAMLGGLVVGSAEQVAKGSRIAAYPVDLTGGEEHAEAVLERLTTYTAGLMAGLVACDELAAPDAFDLLNQALKDVQHVGWMIGAHLEDDEGAPPSSQSGAAAGPDSDPMPSPRPSTIPPPPPAREIP